MTVVSVRPDDERSDGFARPVRMAQVAESAGVSVPTVSKVLNGRPDVSPRTREKVLAALVDAGYRRKHGKHQTRAGLIDLVFGELSEFATEILRGVEEAAAVLNTRVVVSTTPTEEKEARWLSTLLTGRTDGVILVVAELSAAHRRRLASLEVPIVIIDPVGQSDPSVPSIGAANWAGGMAATDHLIELGHRRIGMITGRPTILCSQARLDGYRAALDRAGLPLDPDLIGPGNYFDHSALASASQMLELSQPPTAVFAASDVEAMGVYEAARRHGLRIPEDLSVVGFDDVPMAQLASPPLTTMRQPLVEMAALATRTVLFGDPADFNHRMELSTNLVLRASTGPPPARRPTRRRSRSAPGTA